jgi:hypothetical protein
MPWDSVDKWRDEDYDSVDSAGSVDDPVTVGDDKGDDRPTTDAIELAWCAGFYDGEGCATTTGGANRLPYLRLQVAQKDLRPLTRFQRAVGIGNLGAPDRRTGVSCWAVHGTKAERVAELLWPYLSEPKREQIQAVRARVASSPRSPRSKKGSWYLFYTRECPICGSGDTTRIRRHDEKPLDIADRYEFVQHWDGCNV